MCLNSSQKVKSIAKKDITVYKVLSQTRKFTKRTVIGNVLVEMSEITLRSPRGFKYELGKLNTTNMVVHPDYNYSSGVGSRIENGFHAYRSKERAKKDLGSMQVVVECIIPKGSEYFLGKNNGSSLGTASNKLIAVKII